MFLANLASRGEKFSFISSPRARILPGSWVSSTIKEKQLCLDKRAGALVRLMDPIDLSYPSTIFVLNLYWTRYEDTYHITNKSYLGYKYSVGALTLLDVIIVDFLWILYGGRWYGRAIKILIFIFEIFFKVIKIVFRIWKNVLEH